MGESGVKSVSEYGDTPSLGVPHGLAGKLPDGFRCTESLWGELADSSSAVIEKAFGISNEAEGTQVSTAIRTISGFKMQWVP